MLTFTSEHPPELQDQVTTAFDAMSSDLPSDKAETEAWRQVRLAGWYKTSDGWKQLGPDVRDKVNIRKAEQQPDGTYLIRDVDVFYPNNVKGSKDGKDNQYTPDRIANAISNTNREINSGGQPPGLAKGHPSPLLGLAGMTAHAFGHGFNFRSSPRGLGWVRCDLGRVDQNVVEDWKNGRYTGLSVGFVGDADDLNLRIGHIALLGADAQGLSMLPTVELFQAANQVCFSATPQPSLKGDPMKLTDAQKNALAKIRDAYTSNASAFGSLEAGEPGADAKIMEALDGMTAARTEFAAAFSADHPDEEQDKKLITDMLKKPEFCNHAAEPTKDAATDDPSDDDKNKEDTNKDDNFDAANPSPITAPSGGDGDLTPGKEDIVEKLELPEQSGGSFSAETFNVFTAHINKLTDGYNRLARENAALRANQTAQLRSQKSQSVDQVIADLQAAGHQFDAKTTRKMLVSETNPAVVKSIIDLIKSTPTKTALESGATFAADGATSIHKELNPQKAADTEAQLNAAVINVLNTHLKGGNAFTAEDVKVGSLLTAAATGRK